MHAYSIANIHTARCTVRQFAEHDIDDFMVYRNDMDWMRYQGFKGLTRQKLGFTYVSMDGTEQIYIL